jgi:signal transduction histidine kinase
MADTRHVHQQKILYWIMGVGLILLLAANTLAWLYLQRIKVFFISDLQFRLENIVHITGSLIEPTDLAMIIPGDESDAQIIIYQQLLYDIKENNKLQDIYILSPTLDILVDSGPEYREDQALRHLEKPLINRALGGRVATSELQSLGTHKFLTSVAPLIDSNNRVSGLLVIEARAEFFNVFNQFNQGLVIFSVVNTVIILSVFLLFMRSFRRVFRLQNQIKNQEHLVKLGEMAASVAHELRNPLGIIKGVNSIIQNKYGSKQDEFFEYIPAELDRLNNLIENFLDFARNKTINIQKVNLVQLFDKIKIGLLEQENERFGVTISDAVSFIYTDPEALEQILLNLLKNSFQAISDKGFVKVHCSKEGKNVQINVYDNGRGIGSDINDRIFEPFFSDKEEGSGLGLAISKRLIEQLHGDISISSNPDSGTTVTITLPVQNI